MLLLINMLMAIGMVAIAPWAAEYYKDERLIPILQILPLGLMLTTFSTLPSAMLTREMQFKRRSLAELGAAVIGVLITLWLAWSGFGVWALIWGYVCQHLLNAIFLNLVNPILLLPRFWFSNSYSLISFGGAQTLTTLVWTLFVSMDVFISGRLWSTELVGIYAVALQLSLIPMNKLTPIVKQVALPAYSRLHHHQEAELEPYYIKANGLAMLLAFPLFFGFAAVMPTLIPLLLGEKWLDVILPASLIPLILPFRMSQELMDPVLEAIGRPKEALKNWLIILACITPALYIGASYGGILGLCLAWLIVLPTSFIFTARRTISCTGFSGRAFSNTVFPPLMTAIVMFGAVQITHLLLADKLAAIPLLLLEIATGAVVYTELTRFFCRTQLQTALGLLKRLK